MASGVAQQKSCHVQWDQPSTTASMSQGFAESFSHPVSLPVGSLQSIRMHAYLPNNLGNLGTAVSLASNMDRASSTAPVPNTSVGGHSSSQSSAVEAAAAMAAKINAMLLAKGKLKTPQTLPEKNLQVGTVFNTDNLVTELDINDVPVNCRNFLTKGQTQDKIHQYSGATVSTKGYYMTSAEKAHAKGSYVSLTSINICLIAVHGLSEDEHFPISGNDQGHMESADLEAKSVQDHIRPYK
ncbi:UNVERIFIED_CONTAM: hypothetical protein FKN15_041457 [Acipenser sinensis]